MKRLICTILTVLAAGSIFAQVSPQWIRNSSISPDGKTIAFAWQGDIFTVSADGGQARQITSNQAYDSTPLWTPDGQSLVFCSYREGSRDIFLCSAQGGVPKRLTTYNGAETPLAVKKDGSVLFKASIQADPSYGGFPGDNQIWSVSIKGGDISLVTSIDMEALSVNDSDLIIYEDYKGYEDPLRKHHRSSVTRDIWSYSPKKGTFTKLTTFEGEDREPVFAADGKSFFYLSEEDGTLNVWRSSLAAPEQKTQITHFTTHPVRGLSISGSGILCFSWNGHLYTCVPGLEPREVRISLFKDETERETVRRSLSSRTYDYAVSPDGKEVAIIVHGDVFVTSVEHGTVRRITATPQQERGLSFSADGRTLYYASERDGHWGIWQTSLRNESDKLFTYAFDFKEERLTRKGQTCFQPSVSPDGEHIAYLRDRQDLVIKDIKGGKTDGKEEYLLKDVNYSYKDGDLEFEWSPDSKYILTTYEAEGGRHNCDVAAIDVNNGRVANLTESGYTDGSFHWAMDGKAMIWLSDKAGYRSHGSWGSQDDIYVMFFDAKLWNSFNKDKEGEALAKLMAPDDKKSQKDSLKAEKKYKPDFSSLRDRTKRLTSFSGTVYDACLSADGSKLYYINKVEGVMSLRCLDLKDGDTKTITKVSGGRLLTDKEFKFAYVQTGGGLAKVNLSSGKSDSIPFSGSFDFYTAAERNYIFEHVWKQVEERFYDKALHNLSWSALHDNYAAFLPHINNNFDFKDLLSEMLGELNASHTGARYYYRSELNTGHLGVLFETSFRGKGLKIAEILPGSPLAAEYPDLAAGDIITSIDGVEIAEDTAWYDALSMKAGLLVRVGFKNGDSVLVKASSNDNEALYKRWVRQREAIVEKLSGGKVGYVHVKGMNSDSFREVYSRALGKYRGCEALIVDTRHNGGGWLHDDLATFLDGKAYIEFRPRGRYVGTEPYNKWTKPSCVLIGEDNYSDACGFPYVYKTLGIGKLIGAPVPGTMTAVWWEYQIDNSLVFGIPEITSWGIAEDRPLENLQVEPDILVYNTPESLLRGEDLQLEAAVKEMLSQIKGNGRK